MSRIQLTDTTTDVFIKMAEGNPGGLHVCMQMFENNTKIDPDDFMGRLGAILSLDTHGIYGSRIWMLYKDVCGEDLVNTLALLRGVQLGFLSEAKLNKAIDNYGEGIDVEDIKAQVKNYLPNFDSQ